MKNLVNTALIVATLAATASSLTLLSGDIGNVQFHPDNNPYIVEKDIIVPDGSVVNIPGGVVMLFHPFSGLRVEGRLNVMGSEDNIVVFSSINEKKHNPDSEMLPNPFDWNGIFVPKEAQGAHMNHFSLKYSVYGVKSQCNNIVIQNALFQQNGQFHFTVNEQIKPVVENIPFSYQDSAVVKTAESPDPQEDAMDEEQKGTPAKPEVNPKSPSAELNNTQILRYSSLSVGVAGGVSAAVFGILMNQHMNRMNEISGNWESENVDEWNPTKKKYDHAKIGAIVSGVLGVLGAAGFG
ncbi:MAG: hypothetical protein ACLFVE_14015, partial [Chitinispirillaceae bacterium]